MPSHRSARVRRWLVAAVIVGAVTGLLGCASFNSAQNHAQTHDFSSGWQAIAAPSSAQSSVMASRTPPLADPAPGAMTSLGQSAIMGGWTRDFLNWLGSADIINPRATETSHGQLQRWFEKSFATGRHWPAQSVWLTLQMPNDALELWLNDKLLLTHTGANLPVTVRLNDALKPAGQLNMLRLRLIQSLPPTDNNASSIHALVDMTEVYPEARRVQLLALPQVHIVRPEMTTRALRGGVQVEVNALKTIAVKPAPEKTRLDADRVTGLAQTSLSQALQSQTLQSQTLQSKTSPSQSAQANTTPATSPIVSNADSHDSAQFPAQSLSQPKHATRALLLLRTPLVNHTDKAFALEVIHELYLGESRVARLPAVNLTLAPGARDAIAQPYTLDDARLWSPATPAMYQLRTQLWREGQLIDKVERPLGIRQIHTQLAGLRINQQAVPLRVVEHNLGLPHVGALAGRASQLRDALRLKSAGFDGVRLPPSKQTPLFLAAADEVGLLVFNAPAQTDAGDSAASAAACLARQARDYAHPSVVPVLCEPAARAPFRAPSYTETTAQPASVVDFAALVGAYRQLRPQYYFWQSLRPAAEFDPNYDSGPMVYLHASGADASGSDWSVYSNAASVELWINERLYARHDLAQGKYQAASPHSTHQGLGGNSAHFRLAHSPDGEPFELRAVARDGTRIVAEHRWVKPGAAVRLSLYADSLGVPPREGVRDRVYIYARLLDADGNLVPRDGVKVRFSIKGDARLLGASELTTQAGVAGVLLEIGESLADVRLTARSEGLKGVTLPVAKYKLW